jgi:hypothetical protein
MTWLFKATTFFELSLSLNSNTKSLSNVCTESLVWDRNCNTCSNQRASDMSLQQLAPAFRSSQRIGGKDRTRNNKPAYHSTPQYYVYVTPHCYSLAHSHPKQHVKPQILIPTLVRIEQTAYLPNKQVQKPTCIP